MNYSERIEQFQQHLADAAVDAAFLPISADLQYLTGLPRPMPNFGAVLHPGAWLEGVWIGPQHDPILTLSRMSAEFGGLEDLVQAQVRILGDWDDPAQLVADVLVEFDLPERPRIALGDRTHAETVIGLQSLASGVEFTSATDVLRKQRVIKSGQEIDQMRQAGSMTEAAFAAVVGQLKLGMTELEVLNEVDYQLRRQGSLGPSFVTALYCSGPDHPLKFGDAEKTQLRRLDPPVAVLFDFGAIYDGYCYDFGRTVAFGSPPDTLGEMHRLVMGSQAAGIAALKAGQATTSDADRAARVLIEDAGYGEEFRHRLGHGIGLDVHEPPFLTDGDETALEPGMLFTVEPSITTFGGFSARVEDVVLVGEDGGEPLTSGYQELNVIE